MHILHFYTVYDIVKGLQKYNILKIANMIFFTAYVFWHIINTRQHHHLNIALFISNYYESCRTKSTVTYR